jgi:hypothetical protein
MARIKLNNLKILEKRWGVENQLEWKSDFAYCQNRSAK